MEELQPQDLEDLSQELEDSTQESVPPEVEELLDILQSGTLYLARQDAAEQLGKVGTSSTRIVRALIAAYESDSFAGVSEAAAESLRAPVHQAYMEQHPDLLKAARKALRHRPPSHGGQTEWEQSLKSAGPSDPISVVAWAVSAFLGYARQMSYERRGLRLLLLAALSPLLAYEVGVLVGSHISRSTHAFPYSLLEIVYGKYLSLNLICSVPGLALSLFLGWLAVVTAREEKRSTVIVVILICLCTIFTLAVGFGIGMFMNLDLSRY